MSDIDSNKWLEAHKIRDGLDGVKPGLDPRRPPKGVRPVGCKWVYKRKLGADGEDYGLQGKARRRDILNDLGSTLKRPIRQ
ncbi:UNVERIFIED_CONTAM: hypothetical protein Slati_3469000 [Sesamum latifolium]|uniref:Uncharacterized protein n=1 Tax=Sesamum latifolium TaxID=2727402 RepID=A0AAW2UK93_9LAMI